ncbi:hypothetical protein [Bordetella genomosp. 13]|uniref:Uncharacterized protein n=1 Tax=Bordetella genomosp. 13 TaxID=463040 RepID=A0A1W6Z7M1_9BORD|nr:hypothetical protein [Bordetella genomosp. 13]ARP93307.1 hypothetical protein CAL15_02230 [Bordetella genomosp. 13]
MTMIVALFGVAGLAANSGQVQQWWAERTGRGAEPAPITVHPYNFTGQGVQYAIGAALLAYLPPGAADGRTVLKDGYTPPAPDAPLPVRWRYVNGDSAGSAGQTDYPYAATLELPRRPSDDAVLTLRFYPDGQVAARYTTEPEVVQSGSVAQSLTGSGWKTNR